MSQKPKKKRRRKRTQKEEDDIREEIKIIVYIFFRAACIVLIIWLCKYEWEKIKPPVILTPNDWDLPVYITEVKEIPATTETNN